MPMFLLLPDLFQGMRAWQKTMGPQKTDNSPGPGPEVVERQRVRRWTVQNEMRGVLGPVFTGAAGRILDSANPREKNLTEGGVRCSVDERKHNEHDEGAQVPRWKSRESVCQRIQMRQYASSPRKDKSGYKR